MEPKDKTKYSQASKARIANMSPEALKEKMTNMAKIKWSKMSEEDRRNHAIKMVKARYGNT